MRLITFLKITDDIQDLDVSTFAHEYGEKLSEITTQCDSLIGLNRDLDSAKTEARIAQGALYDAAQSVSTSVIILSSYYSIILMSIKQHMTKCFGFPVICVAQYLYTVKTLCTLVFFFLTGESEEQLL